MAYEIKFTGDSKQAQKAIDQLTDANNKLLAKNKELAQSSKQQAQSQATMGSSISGAFRNAASELGGMVTGLFSVGRAVEFVTTGYQRWREEMKVLGQQHTQFTKGLSKSLTESGDIFRGKEVRQFIEGLEGVTGEQGEQIFAGVRGGAPTATLERRKALTAEVAKLAPTGVDLPDLSKATGELADIAPELNAGDIVDMVSKARAEAGNAIKQVGEDQFIASVDALVKTGAYSIDQAMALSIESLTAGIGTKVPMAFAAAIEEGAEDIDTSRLEGRKKAQTAEGKRQIEFARATPKERAEMLLQSKEARMQFLGSTLGTKAGLLDEGKIAERAESFKEARDTDFRKQLLAATRRDMPSVGVRIEREAKTERAGRIPGEREALLEDAEKFIEQKMLESRPGGWLGKAVVRAQVSAVRALSTEAGEDPEVTMKRMLEAAAFRHSPGFSSGVISRDDMTKFFEEERPAIEEFRQRSQQPRTTFEDIYPQNEVKQLKVSPPTRFAPMEVPDSSDEMWREAINLGNRSMGVVEPSEGGGPQENSQAMIRLLEKQIQQNDRMIVLLSQQPAAPPQKTPPQPDFNGNARAQAAVAMG